jgi:N-acetylglucosamine kinase-like BadF-type ATPase
VGVGVVIGVDGGNSKTDLVAATTDGELRALVRGAGSNSHAVGAEGAAAVIDELVRRAGVDGEAEHGAFFLCGADVPADIAELEAAVARRAWVREAVVDNDTFAVLRAGTDAADAVAVVCGSGINCVGRARSGRVVRYPSLGWETGDWGGSEMLGREALFVAARTVDGRGPATGLVELVESHFRASAAEVGAAVHYGRLPAGRLGELAPAIVDLAASDGPARALVERLAGEIALMVERAFRDLGLQEADVVLGGGMLERGAGFLHDAVLARLLAGSRPMVLRDPPVLGAALAALDAAGAAAAAKARLREELRAR